MQGCWVMDCNCCVLLSHPSARLQSREKKQDIKGHTSHSVEDPTIIEFGIDWELKHCASFSSHECLIGNRSVAALPEMEFPSCTVRALIKEQEDVEHLKESAANQRRDIHIQSTHGSSHRRKVDSSILFNQEGQIMIGGKLVSYHKIPHCLHSVINTWLAAHTVESPLTFPM